MYELYLYRIYLYLEDVDEEAATLVWDRCNKAACYGA